MRKAPNVTSSGDPTSRAVPITASLKPRQRTLGSAAVNTTTSRPAIEAAANSPCGQSITLLTPFSSLTRGRLTWKS